MSLELDVHPSVGIEAHDLFAAIAIDHDRKLVGNGDL